MMLWSVVAHAQGFGAFCQIFLGSQIPQELGADHLWSPKAALKQNHQTWKLFDWLLKTTV